MKVYNTLSRQKETLEPIKSGLVTMYSCGPTVYNYAHIGNLRTYVFMDLLRRALRADGYKLKGVMNVTDVGHLMSDADDGEDKMAKAAAEQHKRPEEIAAYYTEIFMRDIARLNIGKPEIVAKATDHIDDMIAYVEALVEKGYGYETSDGIYFDIGKFPEYGKLSRLNLDDQIAGARVEVNTEKRHPADFALWKKAPKEHIMQWPSPWGMGYPGWHIECSTMSRKYLGDVLDIHTGGVDHIPVHHENEIAQSEALVGHKTVDYWMHGEFMLVDGGKMSKSLGNTYTLDQLAERGYEPLDFRYFCLNAHYRKKLNFTFEGLSAAQTAHRRLKTLVAACREANAVTPSDVLEKARADFRQAVDDDLNIPLALGVLWTLLKNPPAKDIYETALAFDKVLGLSLDKAQAAPAPQIDDIPDEIRAIAEERFAARKAKDWAKSDALRDELAARGYAVVDAKDSYTIKKA
ncbi:MAG: cysteine--tRNA ligase [Clostridia bacterium]|jgi:cysteinyl-tRNA synthetase|nr:cysteine--tRNA ligase [Clostridia bacterium]